MKQIGEATGIFASGVIAERAIERNDRTAMKVSQSFWNSTAATPGWMGSSLHHTEGR